MTLSSWFHGYKDTTTTKPTDTQATVTDQKNTDGSNLAGVRDSLVIENASLKECFEAVSQVNKYPEFLKLYERVDILSEKDLGNGQVEQVAKYVISVPTLLHAFLRDLSYTLKLTIKYGEGQSELWWDQLEGPSFVTTNTGHWIATNRGADTVLSLEMNLGYRFYLPQHLKNYIQTSILRDSLNSIKKRCKDLQARQSSA